MMNYSRILLFATLLLGVTACEDNIDLDLEDGKIQLVVDGFLTSDSSIQTIRLTTSAPYFSNVPTPAENNAIVKVLGPNNVEYNFTSDGEGNFNYNPNVLGALDSVGYPYRLELEYNGATYTSTSVLNPVPPIDSMTYDFEEAELGSEEGYYSQFYARDFAGRKDFYWIRPFQNNEPVYEDPSFLILSEDAAFGGDGADGFVFILPLRAAITNAEEPLALKDTSSVELLSLNADAYQFLDQIINSSGNDGLFATPPANYRSTIFDAAGNQQDEVLGVFSLSSISTFEIVIE